MAKFKVGQKVRVVKPCKCTDWFRCEPRYLKSPAFVSGLGQESRRVAVELRDKEGQLQEYCHFPYSHIMLEENYLYSHLHKEELDKERKETLKETINSVVETLKEA